MKPSDSKEQEQVDENGSPRASKNNRVHFEESPQRPKSSSSTSSPRKKILTKAKPEICEIVNSVLDEKNAIIAQKDEEIASLKTQINHLQNLRIAEKIVENVKEITDKINLPPLAAAAQASASNVVKSHLSNRPVTR